MELTDREIAILELERTWWQEPGPKDLAVTASLGLSTTRYHELLNELIDRPEAEHYDPMTVRRLQRMRDHRRRNRQDFLAPLPEEQSR